MTLTVIAIILLVWFIVSLACIGFFVAVVIRTHRTQQPDPAVDLETAQAQSREQFNEEHPYRWDGRTSTR